MPCIPETVCGTDSDLLFSYPTIKYVRILDARLGLFKYAVTLLIIVYIGIYQLWYSGLYLEQNGVTGAVRFTLQQPTVNSCDPTDRGCKNEFSSILSLPYCEQAAGGAGAYDGSVWPCEFYENIGTQVVMDKSILMTTRFTPAAFEAFSTRRAPSRAGRISSSWSFGITARKGDARCWT